MSQAYRSAYAHIVETRAAELACAREGMAPHLPELRSLRARRLSRALAGLAGLAGACVTIALAAMTDDASPTYALLGSVAAMFATYATSRVVLALVDRIRPPARRNDVARLTGQLDVDLAALDAGAPQGALQRIHRLELWSTALPMAAIALLTPLTLHYAFLQVFSHESARSFASWIRVSGVLVGHAHLSLVALVVAFARRMALTPTEGVVAMRMTREWAKAWGLTIAVSALPGIVLLLVPPALTAITGIAFIPFLYIFFWRRVITERASILRAEIAADLGAEPTMRVENVGAEPHMRVESGRVESARGENGCVESARVENGRVESGRVESARDAWRPEAQEVDEVLFEAPPARQRATG